jgi:hypothetical protein
LLVYCFSVYALYGGKSSTKLALVGISFVIKKKVPFLPRCIGFNALDSEIFSGNLFIHHIHHHMHRTQQRERKHQSFLA